MTNNYKDRDIEAVAMNIVHQIGDVLYEKLPPNIAHEYFVKARQETNDEAIDFAKRLIEQIIEGERADILAKIEELKESHDKNSKECAFCDGYPPCEIEMGRREALEDIEKIIRPNTNSLQEPGSPTND